MTRLLLLFLVQTRATATSRDCATPPNSRRPVARGTYTGLLIDLKLINLDRQKRIRLTEPGIQFAALHNPILDSPGPYAHERFSGEETDFLIGHITSSIPVERFAYIVTLTSIESGSNTPEKLDDSLKKYMPERAERPFSDAFLTTQRAGVISRMADLGLVERARNGPNVTYVVTAKESSSSRGGS